MPESARMLLCARCRVQVLLCSRCDRGQIYCDPSCAKAARRAAQRQAGQRYQSSRPGRFAHAARARRYRVRQKNVTHQGSAEQGTGVLLVGEPLLDLQGQLTQVVSSVTHCTRCGAPCLAHVRLGFLRRRRLRNSTRWNLSRTP